MQIAMIGTKGVPVPHGGIERHVEEIGARLVARGHRVVVYSRPRFAPRLREHRGMELVMLPSPAQKHLDAPVHTLLSIADAVRRGADVLHIHGSGPAVWTGLGRLAGRPAVVTVHAIDWMRAKWDRAGRAWIQLGERQSAAFADRVIAVSREVQRYLANRYRCRADYIPNASAISERRRAEDLAAFGVEPGRYVLYVGRLVPEKGCHYLLEAHRDLDTSMPVLIAGAATFTDAYAASLRAMAGERVRFLGHVHGAPLEALYAHAYLCVVPSDVEGMSLVLLEAMSAGCCVVASDIPANVEAAEGHVLAFPRGDVAALRAILGRLLASPDEVRRVGEVAASFARARYSWDAAAEATERVYAEALAARRRPEEVAAP